MEKLFEMFAEKGHLVVVAVLAATFAIIVWSFLQAGVTVLRDMFLVKFFKKKLRSNGNGNSNGGMTAAQGEELIEALKKNGVTLTETKTAIEGMVGRVGEIHDVVTDKDINGFARLKVMAVEVKELWAKAFNRPGE